MQLTHRFAYTTTRISPTSLQPPPKQQENTPPTHLLANRLPAILALDLPLHDRIAARPAVRARDGVQRQPHADEIDHLVEEGAVGHDDGAVVDGLRERVVRVVAAAAQDGELLLEVAVEEGQQGEGREEDGGDEGGDERREGGGEAGGGRGTGLVLCVFRGGKEGRGGVREKQGVGDGGKGVERRRVQSRRAGWGAAGRGARRSSGVHQAHGDLQHVVPQRKVREALPEALHGFSGAAARLEEGFFGIFEARHRGRWRGLRREAEKVGWGLESVDGGVYEDWMLQPGAAAGGENVMETRNWFQKRVGWSCPRTTMVCGLGCGVVLARRRLISTVEGAG